MNAARILLCAGLASALAAAPRSAAAAAAPATLAPLPVPALHLPSPVERTLPNGLRVVVFASARLPIVHVQLLVPAGSSAESDDQPGVAALTAALLRYGTPSRDREQLAADFTQLGTSLVSSCTRDYALVACGARREALEGALEVMSDAVINPLFGGDGFADARQAEAGRVGALHGSIADAVDARLAEEVFGSHPYAHDPVGDPRALGAIELPAVQAFHRDRWRPDHAVLVIAGDVTADRAFAAAADWFGRWAGHTAPDRARSAPQAHAGVRLFDVPASEGVEVRVAVQGPGLASPGYAAWALATAAFEGARLPEGARQQVWEGRDASALVLSAPSTPEQAVATAQAMANTLRSFAAAPPAGEALSALRRRVAQHYPLTVGTLGSFVSRWLALDFAGAPAGAIAGLGARVSAADPAEGLKVFAAPPVVVVAGPAATLRGALDGAGLGKVLVDSEEAPAAAAAPAEQAPATPEMRRRGKAAVAAAVAVHGGAGLQAMHTLVMEGTISMRMAGQDLTGQFSAARQDPDRFSFGTKIMNMESRQLCLGGNGWSFLHADSTVVVPLDSLGVVKLHAAAASDLVHELRMAAAPGADPAWRGAELVAGRNCDLVDYATPFGRQRICIDAETHRVLELSSGQGKGGQWLDRRVLSDFRRVNGLLLPYVEERSLRGEPMWRMTATLVGTNVKLPPSLFEAPQVPITP